MRGSYKPKSTKVDPRFLRFRIPNARTVVEQTMSLTAEQVDRAIRSRGFDPGHLARKMAGCYLR